MGKKTIINWSSGKDSAWVLHKLNQGNEFDVVGLMTVVNHAYQRVTMHAVRTELLKEQAKAVGLPIDILTIPNLCNSSEYKKIMREYIIQAEQRDIECMAYGDLYLSDVREYRENNFKKSKIEPIFPLWGLSTLQLANEMISNSLKAFITCIDPRYLSRSYAGRKYDHNFIYELPEEVDACGENGEFHTFVYDGPQFSHPLNVKVGEIVESDGFIFADIIQDFSDHMN